jgi:hypothetical protein
LDKKRELLFEKQPSCSKIEEINCIYTATRFLFCMDVVKKLRLAEQQALIAK